MNQEQGLEKLMVWRKSLDFAVWICREVIPQIPIEERFALSDQLRRAAQSVPANIAEGYGRFYYLDNIRFCYIARGSLEEARSHLAYAREMGYLGVNVLQRAENEMEENRRMINGYITYLKSKKPGANEPGASIRENISDYVVGDMDLE